MTSRSPLAPIAFLLQTVICQVIGASILFLAFGVTASLALSLFLSASISFFVAHSMGLSTPWQVLNLVLPLALASVFAFQIPAWIFLALLLVSLGTYAPAFWTRVPYYPTSRAAYPVILAQLPPDKPFSFIDIGCGTAELLLFLSKHRPLGNFVGVEIGALPWGIAKLKSALNRATNPGRRGVRIRFQSMWDLNLRDFDFVYAFLSPAPMERLWNKAKVEMLPGSTFITNTFQAPEPPSSSISVKDERQSVLYLHIKDAQ